jgi:hypothetical protein
MSQIIPPNGSLELTVPAGELVAIATRGRASYALKSDSDQTLDSANPVPAFVVENEEAVTAAVTDGGTVLIFNSGPYDCFAEVGTAPLCKDFRRETGRCGPSIALDTSGDITFAMMAAEAITSAAATVQADLPPGAVLDAASEWEIGEGMTWGVNKTGANTLTVTASTGHTLVGSGARTVILGARHEVDGQVMVEILSGLRAGDVIDTNGAAQ